MKAFKNHSLPPLPIHQILFLSCLKIFFLHVFFMNLAFVSSLYVLNILEVMIPSLPVFNVGYFLPKSFTKNRSFVFVLHIKEANAMMLSPL